MIWGDLFLLGLSTMKPELHFLIDWPKLVVGYLSFKYDFQLIQDHSTQARNKNYRDPDPCVVPWPRSYYQISNEKLGTFL